jgi:4-hydroxy-4-methyl-2-oxoglutarate aldolase
MPDFSRAILEKLEMLDTPTVCNLIELFEIRPRNTGFLNQRIRACFPEMPPTVGFAATATFRASGPPHAGDVYGSILDQVERFEELSGPPIVVFQDLDDPPVAATFGEVMCATYRAFGAKGLVTSGTGRDLDEVRELGFPVFTSGAVCAHGYCHILDVHVPVHVGGVVIYPDNLIHGDCNGVTTIPREIASELVAISDEFITAEAVVIESMRHGKATYTLLREARAEMKERIEKRRQQVSRTRK